MIIRDGDWTLVDHDFHLKRTVWARSNPDGSTEYRTDYVVDPTIEANKAARNSARDGWQGDWHRVASVPLGVYYDQLNQAVLQDDMAYVNRFLNDSDNRAFRTKDGRL